jgi:hypothetical protein
VRGRFAEDRRMTWETPHFIVIRMDAELAAYCLDPAVD